MTWVLVALLAIGTFIAMAWWFRLPRSGYELAGAALLFGLAGYALQGSPAQPGSPTTPRETFRSGQDAMIEARKEMGNRFGAGQNYLITADAMARQGQFGAAATMLGGAVRENPDDPDLWLALGNALLGHAGGMITPASLEAFQRAADIAPDHPGPPFFMGLALAQSGQFAQARDIWQRLLDRPGSGDEPWRADLSERLARLDQLIAMQQGAAPMGAAGANAGDEASGPLPVEQGAQP